MLRSLVSAFRRHGPIRFCYLLAYNAVYYLTRLGRNTDPDPSDLAFDESHRVETARIREIGSLEVQSPSSPYATRYEPSDRDIVNSALAGLDLDWPSYTFVDYGCGKGLVLLLASAYPFKSIVGVEFAAELRQIAARNISTYTDPGQKCRDISVVQADAADYVPPAGPLVCYFYNPFGAPVMRKVVNRLDSRIRESGEPIIVIYLDPRQEAFFRASDGWSVQFRNKSYVVLSAGRASRKPERGDDSHSRGGDVAERE